MGQVLLILLGLVVDPDSQQVIPHPKHPDGPVFRVQLFLQVEPMFDPLRSDPRWQDLWQRIAGNDSTRKFAYG